MLLSLWLMNLYIAYNINIVTTMSNILRTKNGNLSKVKYFLPGARSQPDEASSSNIVKPKQSRSITKKSSNVGHHHNQSVASNGDISF